jgi:Ca2+-binding RTX toxin-like protein
MGRWLKAGMLAGALALVSAPEAMASSVTVSGGSKLSVSSTGNERNQIRIGFDAPSHTYGVLDSAGITAHGSCTQVNPRTVSCPSAGIGGLSVNTSGGADSVVIGATPPSVEATINGGSGNDGLVGGAGDDALRGGSGRDNLDGGAGADELHGGRGTDTVIYADRTDGVAVSVGRGDGDDGNDIDQSGSSRDTVRADIEIVVGTPAGDVLVGDNSSETLVGLDGDDLLDGRGRGDTLLGYAGNDLLVGGSGNDVLSGWLGDDRLFGKTGRDRLGGGPGADFLNGGPGRDALKGKSGIDLINAHDGERDRKINCGKGRDRRAKHDRGLDPRPKSC